MFFLFSISTDELIPASNMIIFLSNLYHLIIKTFKSDTVGRIFILIRMVYKLAATVTHFACHNF